jgi:hypothetical protein
VATVKGFGELLALSQKSSASHIGELTAATMRARTITMGMFVVGALLAGVAAFWLVQMLVPRLHTAAARPSASPRATSRPASNPARPTRRASC